MKINLDNFTAPDLDLWRSKIKAETKAGSELHYTNEIEGIKFDPSEKKIEFDFGSQKSSEENDWGIAAYILVKDEKTANTLALKCLSQGANVLYFDIASSSTNWSKVFKGIHIEYIDVVMAIEHEAELKSLAEFLPKNAKQHVSISVDPLSPIDTNLIFQAGFKIIVNGFHLEQIGANGIDQISTILHYAESLIGKFDADKISFEIGIGSDFFVELSKVRTLKWLWQHILLNNDITVPNTFILGRTGWTNKSLKDPDTNILRQTTEAISGISGGVTSILIHSSHTYSIESDNWFYKRLALNISHILKEESYLSKVNDPMRGAYINEKMTLVLVQKCWTQFLKFTAIETRSSIIEFLKESIDNTRTKKLTAFKKGEHELIGINLFQNKIEQKNTWSKVPKYLNFSYLIFEKEV